MNRAGENNPNYKNGDWCDPHYCILCKTKQITYECWKYGSKKCKHCCLLGIPNKKLSNTIKKYNLAKGKNNPNYLDGRTLQKTFCRLCGKKIKWNSIYCNKCVHIIRIKYPNIRYCKCGKQINKYNKTGLCRKCGNSHTKRPDVSKRNKHTLPKPNWTKYKNIWFRSSWESIFAQWLTLSGYKWKYEPDIFFFGNTSYTPDFYLPEQNLYIEIKGWFPKNIQNKIKLFQNAFPNINLKILRRKQLEELICI